MNFQDRDIKLSKALEAYFDLRKPSDHLVIFGASEVIQILQGIESELLVNSQLNRQNMEAGQ